MKTRRELTRVTAARYRRSNRRGKSRILSEFTATTGYNRAYAALLLRGYGSRRVTTSLGGTVRLVGTKRPREGGGRPRVYGREVAIAVEQLWNRFGQLCGKRLVGLIRASLPHIERDPFLKTISPETRKALEHVSAATVDRLLSRPRKAIRLKGNTHTRSTGRLLDQIPVRTFSEWSDVAPGHVQLDLVGHDGGTASGEFCCTLSVTDVCVQWTERRAILNRAERWVRAALDEIQSVIPFQLQELHPDNGSEFINHNLVRYCTQHHLRLSRSRAERKNDNCYVEQKNFDTVRKLVGYARYQSERAVELLNRLYRVHGLLLNYFVPSQKLLTKTRVGSKVHKRYDAPRSPAERLLARDDISPAIRQHVRRSRDHLNPLQLASEVVTVQHQLIEVAVRPMPGSSYFRQEGA